MVKCQNIFIINIFIMSILLAIFTNYNYSKNVDKKSWTNTISLKFNDKHTRTNTIKILSKKHTNITNLNYFLNNKYNNQFNNIALSSEENLYGFKNIYMIGAFSPKIIKIKKKIHDFNVQRKYKKMNTNYLERNMKKYFVSNLLIGFSNYKKLVRQSIFHSFYITSIKCITFYVGYLNSKRVLLNGENWKHKADFKLRYFFYKAGKAFKKIHLYKYKDELYFLSGSISAFIIFFSSSLIFNTIRVILHRGNVLRVSNSPTVQNRVTNRINNTENELNVPSRENINNNVVRQGTISSIIIQQPILNVTENEASISKIEQKYIQNKELETKNVEDRLLLLEAIDD